VLNRSSTIVRWGVLSTAAIATKFVIPAMQRGRYTAIAAIASRDRERARVVAGRLGIPAAYGSYEELLADPGIDAIYIPLPNHLHVPWSLRVLEAGKHVLCEKPIGLDRAEAETLAEAARRHPRLMVMEAFMYRFHPQWQRARQLAREGAIGDIEAIHTWFSYCNLDPHNIRNRADAGGGGLMDIGCYGISVPRFIFGREPGRVAACSFLDSGFGTDRLTSAIMEFDRAMATFTCATQLTRHQRADIIGREGRIEIEVPFNPPADRSSRIRLIRGTEVEEIGFDACDQYTLQGDAFSRAVLQWGGNPRPVIEEDAGVPTPLADAVANMRIIDAVRQSAREGRTIPLNGEAIHA
jgi:predicted dehydrogenase